MGGRGECKPRSSPSPAGRPGRACARPRGSERQRGDSLPDSGPETGCRASGGGAGQVRLSPWSLLPHPGAATSLPSTRPSHPLGKKGNLSVPECARKARGEGQVPEPLGTGGGGRKWGLGARGPGPWPRIRLCLAPAAFSSARAPSGAAKEKFTRTAEGNSEQQVRPCGWLRPGKDAGWRRAGRF